MDDLMLDWVLLEKFLGPDEFRGAKELERFHFFASRGTPEERCQAAHIASTLLALERICRQV